MPYKPDKTLVRQFKRLIDAKPSDENAIQRFLETHTAFLETPHLLNHGLHLNCVISKLKVGPWSTDFAYLTKSSVGWRLVLVELEAPDKSIFRTSNKHLAQSAEFSGAIAQIDTWRDHWDADKDALLKTIYPLLVPKGRMSRNPVRPFYVLIIGRDEEFRADDAKRRRLESLGQGRDLQILTFDTLLRTYEEGRGSRKCVLSPTARGFGIKHLDGEPAHLFGHVEPQHLTVPPEAEAQLVKWDFDIPSWRKGELLNYQGKRPLREAAELDDSERFQRAIQRAIRPRRRAT